MRTSMVRTAMVVGISLIVGDLRPAAGAEGSNTAWNAGTSEQRDRRMAWWREARFGMFIHWGLYAIPAGEWNGKPVDGTGEWIMNNGKIPLSEYEKLVGQFNPVKFDAKQWVRLAKGAGMKYIVITSKHHDGFGLFDSQVGDYDIMATPFRRDVLKELAGACGEEGVRLCFYHSIMDWHHPDYLPRRAWDTRPTAGADLDRYVAYMKGQLRELLTAYGPIGVLWFDGEWEDTWTHERGLDLYAYVRSLRPDIIINNRVDKGRKGMQGLTTGTQFAGDFGTPEQEVPATGLPGVDWESCMTMNDTWGFKKNDHNWKTGRDLIRMLADVASKGGNLLLNVGPTAEGLIPEPSVERLREIGRWMEVNGESIHGTGPNPFKKLGHRCTTKPGKLYLHVFDWPKDGRLVVPALKNNIGKAYLLADRALLKADRSGDGLVVAVPAAAPDPVDTVVVLEVEGPMQVE